MNWLEELNRDRVYNFKTESGKVYSGTEKEFTDLFGPIALEQGTIIQIDGEPAEYAGFEPIKTNHVHVVFYTQNGRRARKIVNGDGHTQYISESKYQYLKHGKVMGDQLDKSYGKHMNEKINSEIDMHAKIRRDEKKEASRGKVSLATTTMIKKDLKGA
jgi:hypothetical protein